MIEMIKRLVGSAAAQCISALFWIAAIAFLAFAMQAVSPQKDAPLRKVSKAEREALLGWLEEQDPTDHDFYGM